MKKIVVSLLLSTLILTAFFGIFTSYAENTSTASVNPLTGKKALFCGDSITADVIINGGRTPIEDRGWAGRIGKQNNMALWTNMGRNGATVSDYMGSNLIYNQIDYAATTGIEYDYIVISGGTNDAWYNVDIGKVSDSDDPADFDRNTFVGGLEYTFAKARELFPNSAVGFVINFRHNTKNSGNYHRIANYEEMKKQYAAAAEACEKWDIPCLDLYNNEELTKKLRTDRPHEEIGGNSNITDIIHPSDSGYNIIVPYITEWMKTDLVAPASNPNTPPVEPEKSSEVTVTVASVEAMSGASVTVNATLSSTLTALKSGSVAIEYDKSVLELNSASWSISDADISYFDKANGMGAFALDAPEKKSGSIFSASFKVNDSAADSSKTDIKMTFALKETEKSSDVKVTNVSGKLTVKKCEHVPVVIPAIAPSCTAVGYSEGSKCSVCNSMLKEPELVASTGHSFGEYKVSVAPTCEKEGSETATCSACKQTKTNTLEKTAHTPVTVEGYPATSTEPGLTDGKKCSVCNTVLEEQKPIPITPATPVTPTTPTPTTPTPTTPTPTTPTTPTPTPTTPITPATPTAPTTPAPTTGTSPADTPEETTPVVPDTTESGEADNGSDNTVLVIIIFVALGVIAVGAAAYVIFKKSQLDSVQSKEN